MKLVTGLRVEVVPVTFPPGVVAGAVFCVDDPTDCCPPLPPSSGSGSGSGSGAGPPGVESLGLGSFSDCPGGTITGATFGPFSVAAGCWLVVHVGLVDGTTATCSFAGGPPQTLTVEAQTVGAPVLAVGTAAFPVTSATTGTLVVTGSATAILAVAVQVSGLTASGWGVASAAGVGESGGTPTAGPSSLGGYGPPGYLSAAFLLESPGAFSWVGDFTGGGQDVNACAPYVLTEGYRIESNNTDTPTAQLAGSTATRWVGVWVMFL